MQETSCKITCFLAPCFPTLVYISRLPPLLFLDSSLLDSRLYPSWFPTLSLLIPTLGARLCQHPHATHHCPCCASKAWNPIWLIILLTEERSCTILRYRSLRNDCRNMAGLLWCKISSICCWSRAHDKLPCELEHAVLLTQLLFFLVLFTSMASLLEAKLRVFLSWPELLPSRIAFVSHCSVWSTEMRWIAGCHVFTLMYEIQQSLLHHSKV